MVETRVLESDRTRLEQARRELEQDREAAGDEQLVSLAAESATALARAEEAAGAADRALREQDPERVRERARNATMTLEQARERRRELEDDQIKTLERLQFLGERGTGEDLAKAQSRQAAARGREQSLLARAAAARLLYATFVEERAAAAARYVAPLRERVERLGGYVFGDGFSVEVGDDLAITSRTLGGRTVPFDSLSGGTREQLSILLRLAAATLVSADGGVPLLLDDALGYSDPRRLEEMAAVLAIAGRQCQVIVLTCFPERYRSVGGATVVELG